MTARSSAVPADLLAYRTRCEAERHRLSAAVREARDAVEFARARCGAAWTWGWTFDALLPVGGTVALDDAVRAIDSWALHDGWVGAIGEAFLLADGDPADLIGVPTTELVESMSPSDRSKLLEAVAPPPARLADDIEALLDTTRDVGRDKTADIARHGLERWQGLRASPPADGATDPLVRAWSDVGHAFGEAGFSHDDAERAMGRLGTAKTALTAATDDPSYNAAVVRTLGPEGLRDLADLIGQVAWAAQGADDPRLRAEASAFAALLAAAFASATHALPDDWIDEFVESLVDGNGVFDDAALALFLDGEASPYAAEVIGQLGIDLLVGETADGRALSVSKGEGSAWLDGFDEFETSWRRRAAVLIEAAARSPEGAGRLLGVARNISSLTDPSLGERPNRWSPRSRADHDVTGPAIVALIEAGAVIDAERDPEAARRSAAAAIAAVLDHGYDPLMFSDENPSFAQALERIAVLYLPEFTINVRPNPDTASVAHNELDGEYLWADRAAVVNFLALATRSHDGSTSLIAAADAFVAGMIAAGVAFDHPQLLQRAASVSASVEIAVGHSDRAVAAAADARSRAANDRIVRIASIVRGVVDVSAGGTTGVPVSVVMPELQRRIVDDFLQDTGSESEAVQLVRDRSAQLQQRREELVALAFLELSRAGGHRRGGGFDTTAQQIEELARGHLGDGATKRWLETGELPDTPDDVGSLITAILALPEVSATLRRFLDALAILDPPAPTVLPS